VFEEFRQEGTAAKKVEGTGLGRARERRRTRMAINRRQQIRLTPDEQAAFFRERKKAALATIDEDGFPHVVAMNYVARDGAFYMTSYGKAQKVVNIRRNPKVALMIEAGDEYAELRGVMIRGRCEILDDEASVRAAFAARVGGHANASPVQPGALASAPKRVVLRIVPEKVVSWDHRKLGGKY
jgi:PPOX class probable F420-dependent enzyme